LLMTETIQQTQKTTKKTILFVCGHNAGRSQMAEAFFNHLKKGNEFRAQSAGTNIATKVNKDVVVVMQEQGISMAGHVPKSITEKQIQAAHKIFTMGCNVKCEGLEPDADWDLDDPADVSLESIRPIRDQVKKKVEKLIQELEE
jgi:arsenate reductase (thioredoxin)